MWSASHCPNSSSRVGWKSVQIRCTCASMNQMIHSNASCSFYKHAETSEATASYRGWAYLIYVSNWRLVCHTCFLLEAIFSILPRRHRALCWHGTPLGATHPLGYPYLDIRSLGSALREQAIHMKHYWRVRHWPSGYPPSRSCKVQLFIAL